MITIYTIAFNEELMLPYFIRHYRKNFPNCRIVVYDNYSTDSTVKIAEAAGCEVILYDSNNQLDDMKYLEIKNHCWQGQKERWALVADCDELCQITQEDLARETFDGTTLIQFDGINMVNHQINLDVHNITNGVKDEMYSKVYLLDTKEITEINYNPGCHVCNPKGNILYRIKTYPCYHYKYINVLFMINRYKRNANRMAKYGREKGMGSHYWKKEEIIKAEFLSMQHLATKVREPMEPDGLKVFAMHFEMTQAGSIPVALHVHRTDLSKLQIGELQDNRLSEMRLFLSDTLEKENCPYVGFVSWRYNQKCKHLMPLTELWKLYRSPEIVWCAWPDKNWYRQSCIDHPGIKKYLDELIELSGLQIEGTGPLASQFICSIEVYREFETWFRKYFTYFHEKYGYNFDFGMAERFKARYESRKPALFYERFAALYFANRKDLIIKQIPNR